MFPQVSSGLKCHYPLKDRLEVARPNCQRGRQPLIRRCNLRSIETTIHPTPNGGFRWCRFRFLPEFSHSSECSPFIHCSATLICEPLGNCPSAVRSAITISAIILMEEGGRRSGEDPNGVEEEREREIGTKCRRGGSNELDRDCARLHSKNTTLHRLSSACGRIFVCFGFRLCTLAGSKTKHTKLLP